MSHLREPKQDVPLRNVGGLSGQHSGDARDGADPEDGRPAECDEGRHIAQLVPPACHSCSLAWAGFDGGKGLCPGLITHIALQTMLAPVIRLHGLWHVQLPSRGAATVMALCYISVMTHCHA